MSTDVDDYLAASERWPEEIGALRPILLGSGLTEELKWAKPCYTHEGRNIVIIQEMKHFLALMFFKGALLADPAGVLREQGPNSRSARRMEFTSVAAVEEAADTITDYVAAAIDVEEKGLEVEAPDELTLAPELQARLDADDALERAFAALTPGRRREYNLHVSGAKQATTRAGRVEKCVPRILAGKGLRDR